MYAKKLVLAAILAVVFAGQTAGQSPSTGFDGARWIWSTSAGTELSSFPAGVCYFRAELNLPRDAQIESAEVLATADNLFALYVNGQGVGESDTDNSAWSKPQRFDIAKLLVPGRNVVAAQAVNTLAGPAGLLVKSAIRLANGQAIEFNSDEAWKCSLTEQSNWQQLAFEDGQWSAVRVVGNFGDAPWDNISIPKTVKPARATIGEVDLRATAIMRQAIRQGAPVVVRAAPDNFDWPEGIVFVGDDCSLYRPEGVTNSSADSLNVTIFNPRKSRAFPEHDLPSPMKVGRKLFAIAPARPGVEPRLLLDAGQGGIGSPSVSFDGKSILFSMAREDDSFFHIYRLPSAGGEAEQLTKGPFHDTDPAELPDGRIVFSSTRIGTFEEYHSPPSRSLFVMDSAGQDIQPLTHTMIFDNEPEVLADGRIIFIRSDNFFDRGKVETHLHAIHPDGTQGHTEFSLDMGAEYGNRLRAYYCGSPAPLPDGRVAFLSGPGITLGALGVDESELQHFRFEAGDVAAIPDGRLLCTMARNVPVEVSAGEQRQTIQELRYEQIGILDPQSQPGTFTVLFDSSTSSSTGSSVGPLHSPVFLGARPRPSVPSSTIGGDLADDVNATGFLFCQNARMTRKTTAGWSHVRAVRVLAAKGLTTRSSHSYIVHAGSEVSELGTVPLLPDGSFYIEVPANTPLSLQMVDAEGRSELNEMSWIYVRPGEQRSCIGCHQQRQAVSSPDSRLAAALQTPPLKLLGQGTPHRFRGNNAAVTGLMELQFDRYREVAGLNRYADTSNPTESPSQDNKNVQDNQEVAALIAVLAGGDDSHQISAAQRLSLFRDPSAAPALSKCLRDPSREVRVAAAMSLAACGSRESIEPLLDALTSPEPLVAQAAAVAIENLTGSAEPFDASGTRAERRQQSSQWQQWFANTSWEKIEAELIQRLQSSDRDIVRRAAVALGHTGGDPARTALRQYLQEHRDENPFPAWREAGNRGDAARFNSLSPVNPRTLQAATRALGYLRDVESIPLLAETLAQHSDPETGNLFLAEAAAEALGQMRAPEADAALVQAFAALGPYPDYTRWYGDHDALMACHASPLHYFITEALDARRCAQAASIVPHLIRSLPIDPDRALFLGNDDCEALVGRVIRRNAAEAAVVETCLAILADLQAVRNQEVEEAICTIHRCWGGEPTPENRAAQVLSAVCRDAKYEPRVRATLLRYRQHAVEIPRVFDTGIPVVDALPTKNWVCFYLARSLGNLAQRDSVDALVEVLEQEPAEAATGRPDPLGVGVMFLHNELTPCWRAAVAWALGRIGDSRAAPVLLEIIADLDNATDTRHAAAEALGKIGDPASLEVIRKLATDYPEISTRTTLQRILADVDAAP